MNTLPPLHPRPWYTANTIINHFDLTNGPFTPLHYKSTPVDLTKTLKRLPTCLLTFFNIAGPSTSVKRPLMGLITSYYNYTARIGFILKYSLCCTFSFSSLLLICIKYALIIVRWNCPRVLHTIFYTEKNGKRWLINKYAGNDMPCRRRSHLPNWQRIINWHANNKQTEQELFAGLWTES